MIYPLIRNSLFALSCDDAEKAHEFAMRWGGRAQHVPGLMSLVKTLSQGWRYNKPLNFCGVTLQNPVGIAAGIDKQGQIPLLLQAFGAGFITIGSVLPQPQPGNPRPRIFRNPEERALINRLGFNSLGMEMVTQNLERVRHRLHTPIFVSLGKNLDTPIEKASGDYIAVMERLWDVADVFTLCISSPNTPGLRQLQERKYLRDLVQTIVRRAAEIAASKGQMRKPILVKWAPDIEDQNIPSMLEDCQEGGASGLVIANTTLGRGVLADPTSDFAQEKGGLSGDPVFERMLSILEKVRARDASYPIVAVGGISTSHRAKDAFSAGATLVKFNTPLIYRGPAIIREAKRVYATL